MPEPKVIEFGTRDYSAILAKDRRYDSRAYDFTLEVMRTAAEQTHGQGRVSGRELLDWFADMAHEAYGPMSYAVLTDWGVESCEDVGEIMFNLCRAGFIEENDSDSAADFIGAYDFKEEFLAPYLP